MAVMLSCPGRMRDAFNFPVTRFTFGGKLVRTAKSRQYGVQVAIVWIA